jgi:integrase/recombinase XerD
MKKDGSKACFNAVNERIKYKYRIHLRRVKQRDEKTMIADLKHLREYELFTDFAGFEKYNGEIANKYIESLFQRDLSMSFVSDNIRALKEFLRWLERQRGYKSKIDYNQIDYLNISKNQKKEAKAMKYPKSYNYEQIIKTIRAMPDKSDKENRDRPLYPCKPYVLCV